MDVSELIIILQQQLMLLDELIEVVEQKQRILVDSEMSELEALVEKETELHTRVVEMEHKIRKWQHENAPQMKIKDIACCCNTEIENKLLNIRKNIVEKTRHIQKVNECNFILIKYNLDFIDFSFKTISGVKENNKIYDQRGSYNVAGKFNICNMRA